ncbi:MAG: extensin family protein [Hyphomonadaceae bacterium]|jgi:hypothetical protein|nr:extensin family protein [Hyphomonadaceae bacterium]
MARGKIDPLRRRAGWPRALLFVLIASGTSILLRQGLVAPAFNPLPLIDLAQPNPWLVDWRLASIKNHPEICARTLKPPHIEAQPIADSPIKNGCGWHNGVRLVSAGGVRAGFDKLTCETAVALALWLQHEVQPLAKSMLGQPIRSIQSYGSYSCRNIIGNAVWRNVRSQHATANAADIGGFTLADGRAISVRSQWRDDTPEGRFLRAVHRRACPYFRVALGPDYNAAHHDHFHFDRGPLSRCK